MNKKKRILLALGTATSAITPIVTVVACGSSNKKEANPGTQDELARKIEQAKAHAAGLITNTLASGATEPTTEKAAYESARTALDGATTSNADQLITRLNSAATAYNGAIQSANDAKIAHDLQTKITQAKAHAAGLITHTLVSGATEPTTKKQEYEVDLGPIKSESIKLCTHICMYAHIYVHIRCMFMRVYIYIYNIYIYVLYNVLCEYKLSNTDSSPSSRGGGGSSW